MTIYIATRSLMLTAAFTAAAVSSRGSLRAPPAPIGFVIQRLRAPISRFSRPISGHHNGASWEEISNPKSSKTVKLFKSIHKANKSRRNEIGFTVAEGVRLVSDLLSKNEDHSKNEDPSKSLVRRVVISDELKQRAESPGGDQYQRDLIHWLREADKKSRESRDNANSIIVNVGSKEVVQACCETVTSQGVAALVEIPTYTLNELSSRDKEEGFYLILDGLADPGNVGTIFRSAVASGVRAVFLLESSCDPWSPKVVRASMGASFRLPIIEVIGDDALGTISDTLNIDPKRIFAATMESSGDAGASMAHFDVDFTEKPSAIILGREGEGLRPNIRDALSNGRISSVHVPMSDGVESLNAAVCASIICFERCRQFAQR